MFLEISVRACFMVGIIENLFLSAEKGSKERLCQIKEVFDQYIPDCFFNPKVNHCIVNSVGTGGKLVIWYAS